MNAISTLVNTIDIFRSSYYLTSPKHPMLGTLPLLHTDSLLDSVPSQSPGFHPRATSFPITFTDHLPLSDHYMLAFIMSGLVLDPFSFLFPPLSPGNCIQTTTSFTTYSPMTPRIRVQPLPLSTTSSHPTAYLILSKTHQTQCAKSGTHNPFIHPAGFDRNLAVVLDISFFPLCSASYQVVIYFKNILPFQSGHSWLTTATVLVQTLGISHPDHCSSCWLPPLALPCLLLLLSSHSPPSSQRSLKTQILPYLCLV